jgi:alkylation response protein AidB-like acyl-CoA dehydrogenase
MRLRFDAATEAFRAELRDWLQANAPDPEVMRADPSRSTGHLPAWARAWQRRLFDAGWLVPGWPPELGGRRATPIQQLVYSQEIENLPVRRAYNPQGLLIIAPSLLDYAGPAQQEQLLLPTLRAEITWCLGMSEPGAGSDLANLQTRAEVHADRFVVSGQKIWTSGAQHADWCFCFVRTDPSGPKHRGISVLVIDMKAPGIRVRPLPELTDKEHADFNEVFFDQVEVPREQLIGELNHGWAMAGGSLAHERGYLWVQQSAWIDGRVAELAQLARRPRGGAGRIGADPVFRDQYAAAYTDAQALKFMGFAGFAKLSSGRAAPEHSILKLFAAELDQRIRLLGTESLGEAALDVAFDRSVPGASPPWVNGYLFSFAGTIAGGTAEIQRNIIAQRVLGMPRR